MDAIIPSTPVKHHHTSLTLATWTLFNCQVTVVGQGALKGIVESFDTKRSYTTEVRSPFTSLSQVPVTMKRDFYVKVISSQGIPVAIELCPRGLGGGKFYTQPTVPLTPILQNALLNRDPKTPQELVSLLKQIPKEDKRFTRYLGFASAFIENFSSNPTLMKDEIDGLVTLVLSGNQDIIHSVINELTRRIRSHTLLNLDLVHGLADAIDRANPAFLNADDLVQIMVSIVERITKTHTKGAEKSQEEQLNALTRVLNAMVDTDVCDLSREKQEEVKKLLNQFLDSDSIGIRCFATYAKEALIRVPNDETKLAAFFRVSVGVAVGVYYFYAAVNKFDPGKLVDGYFALQESARGIFEFAKQIQANFGEAMPDAKKGFYSVKEEVSSLRQRRLTWYDQIRYVEMLCASNAFQALDAFLIDKRLQKEPAFMYLVVQTLHHVVVSQHSENVKKETIRLLQSIYEDDKIWNELTLTQEHFKKEGPAKLDLRHRDAVRQWIGIKAAVISHLTSYQQILELQESSMAALNALTQKAKDEELFFINRYKAAAPKITLPTVSQISLFFPKANQQYDLEAKVELARALVVDDEGFKQEKPLYVPPMGSFYAGSATTFDLLQEVEKFLESKQRVLLLLGPSGSGKTFFSRILTEWLWTQYQPGIGTIPFYVSLPTVKDPGRKLVQQSLKRFGFKVEEIAQLKQSREIIWILDGYDEIPANTALLETNELLDFKGKIIVTCRTEVLLSNDLFVPTIGDKSKKSLLKEIYFAPFSSAQMDHFIEKYIQTGLTKWKRVSSYRKHIDTIPELFELVQNPFILKIIIDTLPRIIHRNKQSSPDQRPKITRYSLYEAFIDKWFQRGFVRAKKHFAELESAGLGPDNLKEEAMSFCVQLAYAMQSQPLPLTHIQYNFRSQDPFWDTWLAHKPKPSYLRSMSPLKITPGDYAFLHKSLMEYFVAEGTKMALSSQGQLTVSLKSIPLFNSLLEPSVWLFLADVAKSDPTLKQELWGLIEKSKTDLQMAIAAANAASIWNLANLSFSRRDLRGARIPGAYLEGANLVGADFRDADLTQAVLSGAVLSYALSDNANMKGVQFGQWPFIKSEDPVLALVASPDGNQLIGGVFNAICVWDVHSGQIVKKLEGHTSAIQSLILLEGGKKLVSGSWDNTIRIWDLDTGRELTTLTGHTGWVNALVSFDDGKKLASASNDKTIRIWDLEFGNELMILTGHTQMVNALTLLKRGKQLASGSNDNTIRIWDLVTGNELKQLVGHTNNVTALALLDGGGKIASGSEDKTIRIWDVESGLELKKIESNLGSITALTILEGGKTLASCDDNSIRLWDLDTGEQLRKFEGQSFQIKALTLLDRGKKLASGGGDKTIRIWDLTASTPIKKLDGHASWVNALMFLEKGKTLASAGQDKTIRIWNVETGKEQSKIGAHTYSVNSLAYLEDSKRLASAGVFENSIRLWDVETGKECKELVGHTDWVTILISFENGKKLISGSCDNSIRVWDVETGKELIKFEGHVDRITSLALLEGGKHLVSGSSDHTIRVWDLASGEELKRLEGHWGAINALIPLEGNKRNAGETIPIWDSRFGQEIETPNGNTWPIIALTSKVGERGLASGSEDGTIRIWDIGNGCELTRLLGHQFPVTSLALLEGGGKLASGSLDKTIRIWDVDSGNELFKFLCPFPIGSLSFMEPNILLAGDDHGGIWCWKLNFKEPDFRPELLWVTNPALNCSETKLGNPVNLSEPNRRLLLQHGALNEKQ